jgi:hypothetical protein
MISGSALPQRLTEIDDLTRPDHFYLAADDDCYFIGEYNARKGYGFSATNSLIWNFKKPMNRRSRPEWLYKGRAIEQAAAMFRSSLNDRAREALTFVPIPPSKAKSDPLYDDRVEQMLRRIWPAQATDVREFVKQPVSTPAVHESTDRPTPAEIEARYVIDRMLREPAPQLIAVVDDLITTGAHFVAVRNILRREFPDAKIVGLFIARRVPEAVDIADLDVI